MNSFSPIVSIIIPAFNAADCLTYAIYSVINQTFVNWELIIVDDGSTDITLSIAKYFSEKDYRIQVFSKQNSGSAASRNFGISKARGKYILFLDADDILLPNALIYLLHEMYKHCENCIVAGRWFVKDPLLDPPKFLSPKLPYQIDVVKFIELHCYPHSSMLIPKVLLIKEKYNYSLFYYCDFELFVRILSKGILLYNISNPVTIIRCQSKTNSRTKEKWKIYYKDVKTIFNGIYQMNLSNEFLNVINKAYGEILMPTLFMGLQINDQLAIKILERLILKCPDDTFRQYLFPFMFLFINYMKFYREKAISFLWAVYKHNPCSKIESLLQIWYRHKITPSFYIDIINKILQEHKDKQLNVIIAGFGKNGKSIYKRLLLLHRLNIYIWDDFINKKLYPNVKFYEPKKFKTWPANTYLLLANMDSSPFYKKLNYLRIPIKYLIGIDTDIHLPFVPPQYHL